MPRWTFPMTHFVTGERVAEHVPFTRVRFSDGLFGRGAFGAEYPVDCDKFSVNPRDDLGRFMVWPCCNGVPFGAFVLSELPNTDLRSPTIPLQATSFMDWVLGRRELYHSIAFLNQDQLSIARDFIRYAVGVETVHTSTPVRDDVPYSGLPWLQWGQAVSGIYRTLLPKSNTTTGDGGLDGSSGKNLLQLLMDLAERGGEPGTDTSPGFEIRPDYGRDTDGSLWARLTLRSPTIGTGRLAANRVVFDTTAPVVKSVSYGASSDELATRVRVVGREKDGVTPTASRRNTTLLNAGYPLLDASFSTDNTVDSTRLSDKATARARLAVTQTGWAVSLDGKLDPPLGTYRIGDWVILRGRRGTRTLPGQSLRITGWDIEVSDTLESETVTPQFMEE